MTERDEHIILKNCGRWVLHETPAAYPGRAEAEAEAEGLSCPTQVLRVVDLATLLSDLASRECEADGTANSPCSLGQPCLPCRARELFGRGYHLRENPDGE